MSIYFFTTISPITKTLKVNIGTKSHNENTELFTSGHIKSS